MSFIDYLAEYFRGPQGEPGEAGAVGEPGPAGPALGVSHYTHDFQDDGPGNPVSSYNFAVPSGQVLVNATVFGPGRDTLTFHNLGTPDVGNTAYFEWSHNGTPHPQPDVTLEVLLFHRPA